jgi:hypothetical protein
MKVNEITAKYAELYELLNNFVYDRESKVHNGILKKLVMHLRKETIIAIQMEGCTPNESECDNIQ